MPLRVPQTLLLVVPAIALGACGGLNAYYPEGRTVTPGDTGLDTDTDGDSDTDTDTDPDTDLIPIEVTEVDPAHGTSAGGMEVEILGGPFDSSAEVYFGERKGTVLATGRTWLTAETPSGTEGRVAVRVTTDSGEGELDQAYTYWMDGSGQVGTLGSLSHVKYAGSYWCLDEACTRTGTPDDSASALVAFLQPSSFEWWEYWASRFNSCQSDYSPTIDATAYSPGISSMTLKRGSGTVINLSRGSGETPDFYYETTGNIASAYINSTSYSIESRAGDDWPAFDMDGAVSTPGLFSITSPVVTQSSLGSVRRTNFQVSWTGSGGDYVVILADRRGPTGSLELVSCVVDDTGSFQIPSSAWSGWSQDNQIVLQVGRVKEPGGRVPFNDARSGIVGVQWIIGGVVAQ